ncbi:LysR substrate-binding domain-containing protein [Streptomyces sp. NPDC005017]|uniref:LysR substrate-binding domain-containing protein n=1 Tax=Streptomyces sp. NPDC005017 TaxID=3364706 RepID=UPI0036A39EF6
MASAQTGTLRLACCPAATTLFAVDVADALEKTVPGLRVTLRGARSPKQELELLTDGHADAAFMWLPVGDVGLHTAVVRTDSRAVALSTRHPLALHLTALATDEALWCSCRTGGGRGRRAHRVWIRQACRAARAGNAGLRGAAGAGSFGGRSGSRCVVSSFHSRQRE